MEEETIINLDPDPERFLDEKKIAQKILILSRMREKLDDRMIDTMADSLDIEVRKGDLDSRYRELCSCLDTLGRFETDRLR